MGIINNIKYMFSKDYEEVPYLEADPRRNFIQLGIMAMAVSVFSGYLFWNECSLEKDSLIKNQIKIYQEKVNSNHNHLDDFLN